MKLPGKSLISFVALLLALGALIPSAQAADQSYTFTNSSKNTVTLILNYPNSVQVPPTAIRQMVLKPGQSWNYTMNSSLPNVRVDLSGGAWKDYKGTAFFIGTNPGATPGGTYVIK